MVSECKPKDQKLNLFQRKYGGSFSDMSNFLTSHFHADEIKKKPKKLYVLPIIKELKLRKLRLAKKAYKRSLLKEAFETGFTGSRITHNQASDLNTE